MIADGRAFFKSSRMRWLVGYYGVFQAGQLARRPARGARRDTTAMRRILLPPVLPALFTFAGAVVHRGVWRVEPLPAPWPLAAGGILMVTALGLAVSAFFVFRRHDESLDLRKPTRRLVSAGPYRISRNPVYLAFVVFIAGLGCADNAAAVMLAVVPAFAALNWYTIPHEEAYLRRKLGGAYDDYAARVRRWI